MVDGDQLNVIVEPVIVKVAERNLQKYDVIPLFYDAAKAPPEPISKEAQFNGLKRAHLYSNIGEISNMLTRLWNRNNPDRLAAALLTALNNWRIDGAKTGLVNEYTDYPDIKKRINKATGGPNGRMPAFFAFSKNGRRDKTTHRKKKRQWAKPTDSTMNRICAQFDDIGNINMNMAGVPPFNYQMLMSGLCMGTRSDIIEEFCKFDNVRRSLDISKAEESPAENELIDNNSVFEEHVVYTLVSKFGSLEVCYPYIVKYLFTDEMASKSSHKQTFWRVFGDIAIANLRKNLENYTVCPHCNMKVPAWATFHDCPKDSVGLYVCKDCGKLCERTNSKQRRCRDCQSIYDNQRRKDRRKQAKETKKERGLQRIIFLQSPYRKMY